LGKQIQKNHLNQKAVKAMAFFARKTANVGVNATSITFMHQPKEPKNLAMRLQAMKK